LPACVSLFEHLKSTAAIALSLYDFYEDHNTELQLVNNRIAKLPDQDSLLMVCIDISGIQKFIYDISNRRAAVSLKGRSFYLEILLRTVLRQILNHNSINAYDSNVVYSSGGKAYLILPNLDRVKEGLREIQAKVSKELFNDTQAKLFISIGSTSFRYETNFGEITGGNHTGKMGFLNLVKSQDQSSIDRYTTDEDATFTLSMLWRSVSDKAAEQKNRKFKKVLLDDFDRLFLSGKDFEQSSDKCIVTGQRIKGKVEYLYPEAVGADRGPVGEKVYQQIQLGKDLRSSNVIKYHDNGRYDVLGMSGTFSISDISDREVVSKSIYLNKWPDFTKGSHGKEHIFYGGNHLSGSRSNAPKTFEELCTYVNNDVHKVSKLGVLRMDVDNLGQIFIKGIAEPSFAAYSTLSMLLDLFFSGIINKIQLSNPDYKDHIQILYSGGDDVFAVGRWDALLDFAVELRKKFELFTQRADIGLSAGMAIVGAKYPIYKAAEESGNAEKQAKNYKSDKYGDKNAFCIFGEAISWNQEWDTVTELKNRFLQNIGSTGSGFLHTVQNLKLRKDDHHNQLQKGKDGDLSYIWHSAYKLSRMEKSNKDTGAKELIKDIVKNVQQNTQYGSDRYIDLASIAARWAELLHKMNK
jgi:CRISPR-associated protein Csm1